MACQLNFTSAPVNGFPSCHLTPRRSLYVMVRPSRLMPPFAIVGTTDARSGISFPRSSSVVHLRPGRPLGDKDSGAGAVVLMSRPRGYFGIPRDVVLLDGKEPKDVTAGVPTDSVSTLRLPAGEAARPIPALFNEERIVARGWPAAENRIAIAEFTY